MKKPIDKDRCRKTDESGDKDSSKGNSVQKNLQVTKAQEQVKAAKKAIQNLQQNSEDITGTAEQRVAAE